MRRLRFLENKRWLGMLFNCSLPTENTWSHKPPWLQQSLGKFFVWLFCFSILVDPKAGFMEQSWFHLLSCPPASPAACPGSHQSALSSAPPASSGTGSHWAPCPPAGSWSAFWWTPPPRRKREDLESHRNSGRWERIWFLNFIAANRAQYHKNGLLQLPSVWGLKLTPVNWVVGGKSLGLACKLSHMKNSFGMRKRPVSLIQNSALFGIFLSQAIPKADDCSSCNTSKTSDDVKWLISDITKLVTPTIK